ncbi:MAG: rod shape-determining protein RodA [Candidatus Bipolaricaulia bacterium]
MGRLKQLDWPIIAITATLCTIGLLMIYSASSPGELQLVRKQIIWLIVGVIVMVVVMAVDYHRWRRLAVLIYVISLMLLFLTLFWGTEIGGSRRWFSLGFINLQPSEFAKVAVVISLAWHLRSRVSKLERFSQLLPYIAHVTIPALLVFLEPDLGTSIVFAFLLIGMLFASGIRSRHLLGLLGIGAAAVPPLFYLVLQEYQRERLLIFLNPMRDPLGVGYSVIQSKIAIGSGGLLGKGFLQGTQSNLNFLAADDTDFIFSVLAEEFGLIGGIILLALYLMLIWRGLRIAREAPDRFGGLLAVGIVVILLSHVIINVGMATGMLPTKGLPLTFVSYGGSSLWASLIGIGILLNIGIQSKELRMKRFSEGQPSRV